jgi:hypothetical protein
MASGQTPARPPHVTTEAAATEAARSKETHDMKLRRRGLVGGATALAVVSDMSVARGQGKQTLPMPALVASAADPSGFEAALRAKFQTGDVLNWTGGNVRLQRPIHIDVTQTMVGPGLDLNGAKLIADFNDPTQRAITIRIPAAHRKVNLRALKFFNGTIVAASPAMDAVGLVCLSNQSWIHGWKFMNLDIENFSRDGLHFAGGVFEGEFHAVTCGGNGRNGMTFRNDGPKNDTGIVSAIAIFGGQMRKNGNAGIETQSAIPYQEPRDLNIRQTFFIENKGPGLNAVAGLSRAEGCGFVNNGGCGINLMNHGSLTDCHGSTNGPQPYLLKAYLNKGTLHINGCGNEGFAGFEGKAKLAKLEGAGTVTLNNSGEEANLVVAAGISVKMA